MGSNETAVANIPVANNNLHAVLFPFISKGHIIPILHLARLLLRRQIAVTIITTPANRPFIAAAGLPSAAAILELPFPRGISGIPDGIESTDRLPSMSLFPHFGLATERMRPEFESALQKLGPRPDFIVSDGFLWWTQDSADALGIPRVAFYGISGYATSLARKSEFQEEWKSEQPSGPHSDFLFKSLAASERSRGYLVNSFYELEPAFIDYLNIHTDFKAWCVGPLCLASTKDVSDSKDQKLDQGRPVLYVAFGSQAEISGEQLEEIKIGLEESEVDFLWVVRKEAIVRGLELKIGGMIVGEWVDQREVLRHPSVKGFLSHCGWNSVLESVCSGVPILACPLAAEQPLNAKMVAEEMKIGVKVEGSGIPGRVVGRSVVKMAVRELIKGERGKEARANVKVLSQKAEQAMKEGSGSSRRTLDLLIQEVCSKTDERNRMD